MTAYNCTNWMKLKCLSYLPTLRYLGCLQYFNSAEHIFILKGLMILRMIFLGEIFRISGLILKICLRFLSLYYQIVSKKRCGKLLFLKKWFAFKQSDFDFGIIYSVPKYLLTKFKRVFQPYLSLISCDIPTHEFPVLIIEFSVNAFFCYNL